MKRQRSSISQEEDPERNVRSRQSRMPFSGSTAPCPRFPARAPARSISGVSGARAPHSLDQLAQSSNPYVPLNERSGSLSSAVPAVSSEPAGTPTPSSVRPMAQHLGASLESRTASPNGSSTSLQESRGVQSQDQSLGPHVHVPDQSPALAPGGSISHTSNAPHGLQPLAQSSVPHVSETTAETEPEWRAVIREAGLALRNMMESYFNDHSSLFQDGPIMPTDSMDTENMSYEELLAIEERIGNVNRGIDTSELPKYVKEVIYSGKQLQDEEDQCSFCLEQYGDGDTIGKLHCNHEFHHACLIRWITEKAACPICRRMPRQF